jgi:hypothetical protein
VQDGVSRIFLRFSSYYCAILQKLLHEDPYTAEEIEKITGESLAYVFQSSQTSLDVIKAAKHYKLFQVDFMCLLLFVFL